MEQFDVIIIGGSYSGLSAAMALGRALRKVLVIDGGKPANRFTPYSHNFITHDGRSPSEITLLAIQQVQQYKSVVFTSGYAVKAMAIDHGFSITLASGSVYVAKKIILATGIIDSMPQITGFSECWGKTVLHCPYCHGYEVRGTETGILGNGDYAFEFGMLISNWTNKLKIYTNGPSTLTNKQQSKLISHQINIDEDVIDELVHTNGEINKVNFTNGRSAPLTIMYSRPAFIQHSDLSKQLGCELTNDGYLHIDHSQQTTIAGVFACGDNVTRMRTVANAVSLGTAAGMMVNRALTYQGFD